MKEKELEIQSLQNSNKSLNDDLETTDKKLNITLKELNEAK